MNGVEGARGRRAQDGREGPEQIEERRPEPTVFSSRLHERFCPARLSNGTRMIQHTMASTIEGRDGSEILLAVQDVAEMNERIDAHRPSYRRVLDEVAERQAAEAHLLQAKEELEKQAAELAAKSEELARARRVADEASRLKTEFLANMSHEIRTPICSRRRAWTPSTTGTT